MWTRTLTRGLAIVATCASLHYSNTEFRITSPSARYRYQVLTITVGAILLATKAPRRTWFGFILAALSVRAMHLYDGLHDDTNLAPFPTYWMRHSKSALSGNYWNGFRFPAKQKSSDS